MNPTRTKPKAKKAYCEDGRCKLNDLTCADGGCRHCSFVMDGSLMIVLDTIHHELQHIRAPMGDEGSCNCDCDCE